MRCKKLVGLLLLSTIGCGGESRGNRSPSASAGGGAAGTTGGTASAAGGGASSAGGTSNEAAAAGDGAGAPATPLVDITGRWALVGFIDPVGVELAQRGSVLEGRGCLAGVPPVQYPEPGICGLVRGSVAGTTAEFSFDFDFAPVGRGTYTATVEVSRDARRMTGELGGRVDDQPLAATERTAWLPIGAEQSRPSAGNSRDDPYSAAYLLELERPGDGNAYVVGQSYRLSLGTAGVLGDFGTFWWTEIGETNADQSIDVGPVSPTEPDLPIALHFEGNGNAITHVEVTLPAGDRYRFVAGPPQRGLQYR